MILGSSPRTIASIKSFDEKVPIAGGYDKNILRING